MGHLLKLDVSIDHGQKVTPIEFRINGIEGHSATSTFNMTMHWPTVFKLDRCIGLGHSMTPICFMSRVKGLGHSCSLDQDDF